MQVTRRLPVLSFLDCSWTAWPFLKTPTGLGCTVIASLASSAARQETSC